MFQKIVCVSNAREANRRKKTPIVRGTWSAMDGIREWLVVILESTHRIFSLCARHCHAHDLKYTIGRRSLHANHTTKSCLPTLLNLFGGINLLVFSLFLRCRWLNPYTCAITLYAKKSRLHTACIWSKFCWNNTCRIPTTASRIKRMANRTKIANEWVYLDMSMPICSS